MTRPAPIQVITDSYFLDSGPHPSGPLPMPRCPLSKIDEDVPETQN